MESVTAHNFWRHGFDDPARGSQQTFRAILAAMDNPGQLLTICDNAFAPKAFNPASAAACLTLLDYEVPVWIDVDWDNPAVNWLQIGCGCSIVTEPCIAKFVIITQPATMPALDTFRVGRFEYPEKATTIVVQVDDIAPAVENKNCNIFVNNTAQLDLKGISRNFLYQWRQLSSLYPTGIDIFVSCEDVLTALPKTNHKEK